MHKIEICSIKQALKGSSNLQLSLDEGPYYIETSPSICSPGQWIGFYIYVGTYVMKELTMKIVVAWH